MSEGEKSGEQRRRIPFIEIHLGPDYEKQKQALEKLGWTIPEGGIGSSGEITWFWEQDGEPVLPNEVKTKIEYTV